MKLRFFAAATVLVLSVILLGCAAGVRSAEPRVLHYSLDKLAGGDERLDGSGRIAVEEFGFRGFTKVDVSHTFQVELIHSSSYKVVIRLDDNLLQHLQVEKRADTLIVGLKPHRSYSLRNATLEAEVHMPDLRAVEASGASDVRLSGFTSLQDFEADLSGASYLEGELTAREVRIEVSGASRLRLRGKADDLRLEASGASNLDLGSFPVGDAEVKLSGASEAEVVLNGTLDIEASGASRLYFGGSPSMGRIDLSGASSIKRR